LVFASGRTESKVVPADLPTMDLSGGPWAVQFLKTVDTPAPATFDGLQSWTESANPHIKYFSGTATYSKDFQLTSDFVGFGRRAILDLGSMGDLAKVTLNGQDLGVLMFAPFRLDVTRDLKVGVNHLEISVTNTWRNRLIGDEQQQADVEWGGVQIYNHKTPAGRPLAAFPKWLVSGTTRPSADRYTFTTWNYFTAKSPLEKSGLLGPVILREEYATTIPMRAAPATLPDEPGLATQPSSAVLLSEFIFRTAPFPSCHASTIAQTKSGLVAAFFGGTRERAPDVGIWVSRLKYGGKSDAGLTAKWSPVVEVATGIQPDGPRLPCWNPVLFQPSSGPLMLFYKVGPAPAKWWGMMMTSSDEGATWS
jgi:hypothetical protein